MRPWCKEEKEEGKEEVAFGTGAVYKAAPV